VRRAQVFRGIWKEIVSIRRRPRWLSGGSGSGFAQLPVPGEELVQLIRNATEQRRRARSTRHCDEALIVPPFFKCLETLKVDFGDQCDTGDLFAQ